MIAKQAVDPRPAGRRRHLVCGEKLPREQLERVDDIVGDRRISGDDGKRDRSRSGWPALSRRERDRCAVERSEEHTSELQSLMRISYAVFCLKKKKTNNETNTSTVKSLTEEHD